MEITPADWHRVVDVNMTGVLYLSQAFIPHMRERKQGTHRLHVVGVGPARRRHLRRPALFGGQGRRARAWPRRWRASSGRTASGSTAVTPGLIQTDITGGKLTDEMRAEILKGIPLNRLGDAEDVAKIYLFLASDLSAYVTGAVIDVNGGMLIH